MSWLASKLAWTVELSVSQAWNFPLASVSAESLAATIRNASSGSASLFAGLAGHGAGSGRIPYWAQSTGNYIDMSEGEWANIRPWISSAQLARYGQQFHLVFRPFSSLQ